MIKDGKRGRLQVIRAWAPVVVWVVIVLTLGTTPGLFQRYHALLRPWLQPAKTSVPTPSGSTTSSPRPTHSPSPKDYLIRLVTGLWRGLRPLLARVMLNSSIMERVGHFLLYMVLGLLIGRANALAPAKLGLMSLLVAAVALAAFDETLQRWVPLRSSSIDDWMVDIAGVTVGLMLHEMCRSARKALARK